MRTGLAASTVTPGSTAPDASLTTPVIDACASAVAGSIMSERTTAGNHRRKRIAVLDRFPDIEGAFLGIERKITGEQHVVETEERQPELHSRTVAEERGV